MLFVQFEGVPKFAGILSAERSSSQIRLCDVPSMRKYTVSSKPHYFVSPYFQFFVLQGSATVLIGDEEKQIIF